jgi:hypothetical protein
LSVTATTKQETASASQSPHFSWTTSPFLLTSVAHHAAPLLEWSVVHRLYDLPLKLNGKTHRLE